jgi:hypothetical protein
MFEYIELPCCCGITIIGGTMARSHYFLSVDDLAKARGSDPDLAFAGAGPNDLAAVLQQSLRDDSLFERWRAAQSDPDAVDQSLGATDPEAQVTAQVADLHIDIDLQTSLPMSVVRHRLNLLIGASWTLRDMRSA